MEDKEETTQAKDTTEVGAIAKADETASVENAEV